MQTNEFWGVLQLMGHVRIAGKISEEERFGAKIGRIDIPREDGTFSTEYFGAGSIYRVQATTEEIARKIAAQSYDKPIHSYEMPKMHAALPEPSEDDSGEALVLDDEVVF